MRAQTRSSDDNRAASRQRRADRTATTKLNRSQIRAMEIRSAETVAEMDELDHALADHQVVGLTQEAGSAIRRSVATSKRTIARPVVLSKIQEYRFIRADLRRLILTASSLFVVMIALLFVID